MVHSCAARIWLPRSSLTEARTEPSTTALIPWYILVDATSAFAICGPFEHDRRQRACAAGAIAAARRGVTPRRRCGPGISSDRTQTAAAGDDYGAGAASGAGGPGAVDGTDLCAARGAGRGQHQASGGDD